jgi:hypothetical protein
MSESESKLMVCPHCGNHTPHKKLFEHSFIADWYSEDGTKTDDPPYSVYHIFACATCNDLSIFLNLDFDDDVSESALRYPEDVKLSSDVPKIVSQNYKEAKRVQKVSPNAFAVLLRRALEALCDERKVPAGKLHARLADLAARGEIPPVLAEMSTVLRVLGNSGAHNTEQSVTVPMTWSMDTLFRTLVEYVYVAPAKLETFKQSLAKLEKRKDEDGA